MDKLTEELEVQRLKVLARTLQAGDRQTQRGQTPWAQKLMMEELQNPRTQTTFIQEMQKGLQMLNLEIIANPDFQTPAPTNTLPKLSIHTTEEPPPTPTTNTRGWRG